LFCRPCWDGGQGGCGNDGGQKGSLLHFFVYHKAKWIDAHEFAALKKDLPSIGRLSCSQTIPTDFILELLETLFDDVALPVNLHCLNRGGDDIAANCLTTVEFSSFSQGIGA
jgi:hypothetical protein